MAGRAALNRSAYIEAALEVIAEVGVDKLSMRNVASRLSVSPMAMYNHFPTKDDLLAASLEEFIARANVVPDTSLPWEQWVEHTAIGMYRALCRELSWVPLLGSLPVGEQAITVTEAFVTRLCEAGFTVEQSLQAYFAVIQVVIGAVCLRASLEARRTVGPGGGAEPSRAAKADARSNRDIRGIPGELQSFLQREQIGIGLPLIIAALRTQLGDAGT